MQEGYCTCPVCLSVYLYRFNRRHCLSLPKGIERVDFRKKTFRWKVMARKSQYANKQLPLATGFSPFRVYTVHRSVGIYSQAAHWVSDRFLARFAHRGCCYGLYLITSIHLPRSRSALLQRTSSHFSVDGSS